MEFTRLSFLLCTIKGKTLASYLLGRHRLKVGGSEGLPGGVVCRHMDKMAPPKPWSLQVAYKIQIWSCHSSVQKLWWFPIASTKESKLLLSYLIYLSEFLSSHSSPHLQPQTLAVFCRLLSTHCAPLLSKSAFTFGGRVEPLHGLKI